MATVFAATAQMALFRRPYTTTSSASDPLPTPTALAGLLAAIVGLDHGGARKGYAAAYWRHLAGTRLAVRLMEPLRWRSEALNFWNVKNPSKNIHIQVKHQFIWRPRYRLYVEGGLEEELDRRLRQGGFVYTPFLGVAYALADLTYIGRFAAEEAAGASVMVDTVVPNVGEVEIDVLRSQGAFRERLPFRLDEERRLVETLPVLYQSDPKKKLCLMNRGDVHVSACGGDTVAWFPAW